MNILEIKKKINVKEELLSLYEKNNISVEETKDGYIIVDNMFLVYVSENKIEKMGLSDVIKEYFCMEQVAKKISLNQFIIVSKSGFECELDSFSRFNIRLEDNSYFEELKLYSPGYVELLCHNRFASKYVKDVFKKGKKRACVIQPTGTGKSYIIESILKDYKGREKVVITPNNYIIDQLKDVILRNKGDIANIEFLTYSKLMQMKNDNLEKLNPEIIILDEIHRIGAEVWGKHVLNFLDMNSHANVFGATATPVRESDGLRDMSIELFGLNVLNNLDLGESIAREILPMPKYVTAVYEIESSLDELIRMTESSRISVDKKEQINEDIRKFKVSWDSAKYIPNIISKYVGEDRSKFIVFCKNKEHLDEMINLVVNWFKKAFPNKNINYNSITSFDYKTETKKVLQSFRDKKSDGKSIELLFSINKLNEGIHIVSDDDLKEDYNGVDGVIFLRATSSKIIYFQQLGRALTANSKKQPLILDLVNNIDVVNEMNFKEFLKGSYNKRNEEYLNLFDRELDLSYLDNINLNVIDETKDFKKFFEKQMYRISDNWDSMYRLLIEYISEYGHCNISKYSDCLNGKYKGLGTWVSYNRHKYLNNTLEKEKINKLNKIGFVWNLLDAMWLEKYNELVKYKEEHGHCYVPFNLKETKSLTLWMGRQVYLKRTNKLSEQRIQMLDDIGFVWDRVQNISFEDRVASLKEYKRKYGTCNVTLSNEYASLCNWVRAMRKNKKKGKLSEEQISILNSIGFCWDVKEAVWLETFNIISEHVKKHGTLKISSKTPYYNKATIWLAKQRKYNEDGKLDENRRDMLKSIGAL